MLCTLNYLNAQFAPQIIRMHSLHHKLFECTVCTLNYDSCYTLHPYISFNVKMDRNMNIWLAYVYLLKWHKLKRLKTPYSQSIKFVFPYLLSFSCVYPSPNQNPYSHKSTKQNHLWHYHCFTTMTFYLSTFR